MNICQVYIRSKPSQVTLPPLSILASSFPLHSFYEYDAFNGPTFSTIEHS